jgi:hypothetical protein
MPDLAFSNANNITDSWTCQQLLNTSTANLGYDVKEPDEEDTKEEDVDGE